VKTVVVGATGHIGSTLVRLLVQSGREVRVVVRPSSDRRGLEGLDVEVLIADVLDAPSLRTAFADCDVLYHLASPGTADPDVAEIARCGTQNVFQAMARVPTIRKAVYTSSTVAVGYTSDPRLRLDETTFSCTAATPYHVGKFLAEQWLADHIRQTNAPIVIVTPCMTIGPNDFRTTDANRVIVDYLRRRLPVYFTGGLTIAAVGDIARGHLLAELRGVPGERYILGGDCVTIREHLDVVAETAGVPRPIVCLPRAVLLVAAALGTAVGAVTGRRPPLPMGVVRNVVGRYAYYSSAKAVRALGYTWTPHLEAVRQAVAWLRLDARGRPAS
jgi:dihydroflavonol-4-reductase